MWSVDGMTVVSIVCAAVVTAVVLVLAVRDESTTARGEAVAFIGALVLYGVFFAAFFRTSVMTGDYIAPSDSLDFGVADYLAPLEIWTQAMWSGYPIAADPQSLTWYPLLRLFRLFGADWNTFLVSAYVLASAAGFLFVRRLAHSTAAGVFAGFICGFGGMMIGYLGRFNQVHAFAWVPLALYGLQLIREDRHRAGAAVGAMAFALMWLAGHPQIPVYTIYLGAAIVGGGLLVDRPPKAVAQARMRWSAAAVALGVALAAIALLPMIELGVFGARRPSWELYRSDALPVRELVKFLVPLAFGWIHTRSGDVPYVGDTDVWAYVGLLPIALALAGPFILSRHRREARVWLAFAAIETLLCLGTATPVGVLFFLVPGYANFQTPLRHLFLVTMCLATASGLGVAELTDRRERRGTLAAAVGAVVVLGAGAYALLAWRSVAVRQLIAGPSTYVQWALAWPLALAGTLVLWAFAGRYLLRGRVGAVLFGVLLIATQVIDLTAFHVSHRERLDYADIRRTEAVLHPRMVALRVELERTGERVLATDGSRNQFLLPNLTRAWRVPAASGTGSLAIRRYIQVLDMETAGAVPPDTLSPANRGIDLFAVRYALVRQDSPLAIDLSRQADRWVPMEHLHYYEEDPDTHYTLFRNLRAQPRAWCAPEIVPAGPDATVKAIRLGRLPNGAEFDPRRTAIVETGYPEGWVRGGVHTAGEVVADPAHERYTVTSATPCVLVVSEVSYPWWRASLDGAPVDVLRVNHAMVGIVIPAGSHLVRLWFRPVSVWIGGAVSGIALLLCAALLVPARVRRWRVFFLRVQKRS